MFKFFTLFFTLIFALKLSAATFSNSASDYYDYITQKTIEDFNAGVKNYNEKKSEKEPGIYKGIGQNFNIVIKTNRIRFTVLNYIKDEMYINDKLVKRSTFEINKKITWVNPIFAEAVASEGNELDAESTKILLTALGGLQYNLEEVGMLCFMGCKKDVKNNNRKKIFNALERQHDDCNNQLYAQENTIKRYRSLNMVSLLHSTFDPDFISVRKLIQKVSESNIKKVKEFMADKMLVTKNYQTCVEVITSGTAADGAYSATERGLSVLIAGGTGSMVIEEEIEKAKAICVKMEELRTCLVTLKKNLNSINSFKREVNRKGYYAPEEKLPDIKSIDR
jgi:hypothetical protein